MSEAGKADTVHILIAGQAACGIPGPPIRWPENHKWVRKELGYKATCDKCRSLLPEILAEQSSRK